MSRKALQSLQPSAKNQRILVGSEGDTRAEMRLKKGKNSKVGKVPLKNDENSGMASNAKDNIIASITSDEESLSYWKELAEERRKALCEALQENENLHKTVAELKDENEFLKSQNKALEDIAEEAQQLALLLEGENAESV